MTIADRSLDGFISWLQTQDPTGTYDYCYPEECAVAQFLKSIGSAEFKLTSEGVTELLGDGRIVNANDQTFGGALTRANAFKSGGLEALRAVW